MKFITLPGIGGSGDRHWQTFWETDQEHFKRISVADWDKPSLEEWLEAVDIEAVRATERAVLVAHSLSCLLATEYALQHPTKVRGLFLVAPPDPSSGPFPRREAAEFVTIGQSPLACPSIVLASSDDPYGSFSYAKQRAALWGSGFIDLGDCGHVNDLGGWPEGRRLLDAFAAGLGRVPGQALTA